MAVSRSVLFLHQMFMMHLCCCCGVFVCLFALFCLFVCSCVCAFVCLLLLGIFVLFSAIEHV